MNVSSPTPKAGPSGSYYVFLIIYLAGLSAFGSFVNDMYLPSLPSMTHFFHCSVPTVELGLTLGMAGLGLGEVFLGPMSDKWGRKPVLVGSLLTFIVASLVSVLSPTIHFFILCRFVQGLGASGGYFLAKTIPADIYGGRQLAKLMAVVGAINGVAPASAPVIGGFVCEWFNWKGVFIFLAAFGIILLIFSPKLKETLPPARRDHAGLGRAFKAYGVLGRNRRFMTHVMLKGTALGFLFAYISSAPFIIQTHYGFSESVFGLIMGFNAVFVATGSMLALKFKVLKRSAVIGGIVLLAAVAVQCLALWKIHSFYLYEGLLLPILFSLGMIFTTSNTLAMNEGRAESGAAAALLGLIGYVFGAVVSPLVGMGNILHSTAIVFAIFGAGVFVCALLSRAIPADLDTQKSKN